MRARLEPTAEWIPAYTGMTVVALYAKPTNYAIFPFPTPKDTPMLSIGLMSGTSMDGIDAGLINTDGYYHIDDLSTQSLSYAPEFKLLLKIAEYAVRTESGNLEKASSTFSQHLQQYLKNEYGFNDAELEKQLLKLQKYLNHDQPITLEKIIHHSTALHAELVLTLLNKAQLKPQQIDVIGYHGQTLLHRPHDKITIQVGDGNLLAQMTGITVVNDFRRRDVLAGGHGAPLAPLYHQALAIRDKKIPLAVVNCGGIANLTVISGDHFNDILGFDTGPGNGLIDRYIKKRTQGREHMDSNGQYGKKGKIDEAILKQLYNTAVTPKLPDFFTQKPPKSLDIGDLILIPELDSLSIEDTCATLEAFTADTIVNALDLLDTPIPTHWILAGGGWHNPVIRRELETRLQKKLGEIQILTADEAGWNNQALEAQIFAYLAVRSRLNLPISFPNTTFVPEPMTGGQTHFPPQLAI